MTAAPSFSSFPELPGSKNEPEAGPSKAAPSFASFPDLESKDKRRSRSTSLERDQEEAKRSKRRERDPGDQERHKSERRRDERYKSERKDRDGDRSDERRRGDRRDRERGKVKEKARDRSAERRYKEDRRRRDREQAEQLIRGEPKQQNRGTSPRGESKREDKWAKVEDGQPWYESSKKVVRNDYEEAFDPTSSKGFFTDTVGDRDIARYGSSSSTSAPRYYRDGKNRILGLAEILRIVYTRERTQKGVEIAPMGRPYIPRYSARPLESSAGRHLRRILLQPSESQQDTFDPQSDIIPLETFVRRDDPNQPAYRSITHQPDEEEEELAALQAAVGNHSTLEDEVRKLTTEMERHLRDCPEDADAWIEYSRLHLRLNPEPDRAVGLVDPAKLPTTRAQAEVTLSILSRALDADERNMSSVKLHLAYLRAAETFWPSEKVTGRWNNVLRELGDRGGREVQEGMMDIWLRYISWREGQGFGKDGTGKKAGGVDEVVDVYLECLGQLKSGSSIGADMQVREENIVYLFLRACLFLKQAGYEERALAAFQALMEITFFKPDHLRYTPDPSTTDAWFSGVLTEFEAFWDDEVPRLGENGAQGWRNSSSTDIPSSTIQDIEHSSTDPFERWLEAEKHADTIYARPGRATDLDEATEDDPFHIVLFTDIQPFLFPIFTPEVRLQLIYAFLTFLGLPFTPPGAPTTSAAGTDPHFRWNLAYNESLRKSFWPRKAGVKRIPWQTVGGEPMEPERGRGLENPFECPIKCWTQERSTMFAKPATWFKDIETASLGGVDVELVRNVFALMRPLVPDPAFSLASLAFESAVSPKSAVKLAKTILAADRDNLLLWEGYARLERQRGNLAAARMVYITALQAAKASRANESMSEDEIDLWAGWVEMEFFDIGENSKALEILVMAAGVGEERISEQADPDHVVFPPTSISMLKAKQFYSTLSVPYDPSKLLLFTLFTYLSDGVESARSLVLRHLTLIPPSSAEAEEALQLLTRLLHVHTTRNASPASLARDILESALSSFPNNTSFLSLYLYGELGGRVYGRIQRLIADSTSTKMECGVVSHLWAIWAEGVSAHRTFWDQGGRGAERVRMALDRGINSGSGRHSAALWMLYIEFESLMGRYNTAKQLCYRAVSSLGGCKPLYLLPFSPALRPHFTTRELKDWGELILERGIRIRVPFDDFWTNDADSDVGEGMMRLPDDEDVEDDELGFLSERQALKPY